tara:strand:+ start:6109 stop:6957 length:849 start_codon:yes stop_codon:yes gene_type:complete
MATSRDDFVIAIRSAFLKKGSKQRFSLIGLIFSSIFLIILNTINFPLINYLKISLNEVVYRSSFIVSIPEKKFQEFSYLFKEHFLLYSEYKSTKEELKKYKLKQLETDFIISENQRLKLMVEEYIFNTDELFAKVLIDKKSPFLRSIIVNRGSKDNVALGMAVLDGGYLIGKIIEVNYSTSRVLLISDLNSKIPVSIEPGNIQSILSGTGQDIGKIEFMQKKISIENKSVVYSSGSGGIFKAGIPIGIISLEENGLDKYVNFYSDLSQLTFVKLVSFKKDNN